MLPTLHAAPSSHSSADGTVSPAPAPAPADGALPSPAPPWGPRAAADVANERATRPIDGRCGGYCRPGCWHCVGAVNSGRYCAGDCEADTQMLRTNGLLRRSTGRPVHKKAPRIATGRIVDTKTPCASVAQRGRAMCRHKHRKQRHCYDLLRRGFQQAFHRSRLCTQCNRWLRCSLALVASC